MNPKMCATRVLSHDTKSIDLAASFDRWQLRSAEGSAPRERGRP